MGPSGFLRRRLVWLEIWLGLAFARFLTLHVRPSRWRRLLGPVGGDKAAAGPLSARQQKQAADTGILVARVARRIALFEAVCLPQAMTARWMLGRRGIDSRIIIGSRRKGTGGAPEFHAWLVAGDRIVIGQEERAAHVAMERAGLGDSRGSDVAA